MNLDPATLSVVACIMSAVIGALLMFSWFHDRRSAALGWWSVCALTASFASLLYMTYGASSDGIGRQTSNGLFAFAFSLSYGAARRFNDKPMPWVLVTSAPLLWASAAVLLDLAFYGRLVLMSVLVGGFAMLTAHELWRASAPDMPSRRAAAIVTAINGLYFLARPIGGPGIRIAVNGPLEPTPGWLSVVGIVIILYGMIFGFLIMAMAKEKADRAHRLAALVDPLTGIANRRAFIEEAGRLLASAARAHRPAAAIMFDLDHFKAINDTYGHLIGDHTLIAFCAIARSHLPPRAVLGRLGGEEFAVLVDGMDHGSAMTLAETIRGDLVTMAATVMGHAVAATVSAGVAARTRGDLSLSELTNAADTALYRAKALGRNRVVGEIDRGDQSLRRAPGVMAAA